MHQSGPCQRLSSAQALRVICVCAVFRETRAQSDLATFMSLANGIRADWTAVEAAFRLPWSNRQLEGQINRVKLIKRQGYGRAKFDLLRRRVLLSRIRVDEVLALAEQLMKRMANPSGLPRRPSASLVA